MWMPCNCGQHYFMCSNVQVNASKLSCMLLMTRQDTQILDVSIGDTRLNDEDSLKYLVVHISNKMAWNVRTSNVCKGFGRGI